MKNYFLLLMFVASSGLMAQDPTFVGHRGASWLAPENTVASVQLAWEIGAPAAECDIMLTADKQIVVFHDKDGKRLTGHDFKMNQVPYDSIRYHSILLKDTNQEKYRGETIPLLSDLLAIIPHDRTLVIEIKTGPEILPFLEKVISEHHKSGNIAFIAFAFETILATKAIYPEIPCFYLSAFRLDIKNKFGKIAASNLDGVNLRHNIVSKKLVRKFRKADKAVWCWTVNNPEDARKVIDAGVTAITTDRPAWLKDQLQ